MKALFGIFLAVLVWSGGVAHASSGMPEEGEVPSDVLIVYDKPDLLELTENILTAFNKSVDTLQIDEYEKIFLKDYSHVVLLTPKPLEDIPERTKVLCVGEGFEIEGVKTFKSYGAGLELRSEDFYQYLNHIDEFSLVSEYEGKSFGHAEISFDRVFPFGIKTPKDIYYVPYLSEDNISTFAMGEMLPDFFDIEYKGGIYVIIKDVFAFSDLDMLCKTADQLYLANIPFIVKVMPLYSNEKLDAFARYTQALRYVESRNGAIVMTPAVVNGKAEDEEIDKMTDKAIKLLEDDGVTVLPQIEGFYNVTMEFLKEVKSPEKRYESFSFDVGIIETLPLDDLQLKQMIANLNGRWYEFGSYREKFGLESKMFLEVPVDEAIATRENVMDRSVFFDIGNDVLTVIVSAMLLFIGLLIYISRVSYKRKFKNKTG